MTKTTVDWLELYGIGKYMVFGSLLTFAAILGALACSDDYYLFGYNKNMEEISRDVFVIDSTAMQMSMSIDSLYQYSRKINTGH